MIEECRSIHMVRCGKMPLTPNRPEPSRGGPETVSEFTACLSRDYCATDAVIAAWTGASGLPLSGAFGYGLLPSFSSSRT